ncbi:hypothetical protein OYT1_ch1055 [Ferriphaselus amnicola]|uniref:ATP-grasp domain-containing protein n=1 Tax=Ferriphaselus amnicola TaxID=1188319 RepID=A0A2Z6GBM0_9PROT|nr:glutathione synthase [Ferriphaselus amnicola]BBE50615.1 hypothetical protein OYT1_ch1055 [Ferriphaselus amnicola]
MNARHLTHPAPLIGQAAFTRMVMAGIDLAPIGQQLLKRAEEHPSDANTMMDLSSVMLLMGKRTLSLQIQRLAIEIQQLYTLSTHEKPTLRLLALMSPGDMMANTPLEFLLERSDIQLDLLFLKEGLPASEQVPDHDVLFVGIGESDANLPLLHQLEEQLRDWPRPVLNLPRSISHLSRDGVYALLHDAPGVVIPQTLRVERATLEALNIQRQSPEAWLDGGYPLIVRPVDSHAGQGLDKLDGPADVGVYLTNATQHEFFISRFVDYRNADGQFRKYRIALIAGKPYLAHLAISSHWMIHYLNAGMSESAEKRAEEEFAMVHFDREFACRHQTALTAIHERMGLDYLGIDCAETDDGKLLIFEVDTSMVVHSMDPVDIFPYKQPQMHKVFAAFRSLLLDAAKRPV